MRAQMHVKTRVEASRQSNSTRAQQQGDPNKAQETRIRDLIISLLDRLNRAFFAFKLSAVTIVIKEMENKRHGTEMRTNQAQGTDCVVSWKSDQTMSSPPSSCPFHFTPLFAWLLGSFLHN